MRCSSAVCLLSNLTWHMLGDVGVFASCVHLSRESNKYMEMRNKIAFVCVCVLCAWGFKCFHSYCGHSFCCCACVCASVCALSSVCIFSNYNMAKRVWLFWTSGRIYCVLFVCICELNFQFFIEIAPPRSPINWTNTQRTKFKSKSSVCQNEQENRWKKQMCREWKPSAIVLLVCCWLCCARKFQ